MSAFRLYSRADSERLRVALAHGYPDQAKMPLFFEQHLISPISAHPMSQFLFIRNGVKWIRRNIRRFDVFHGLQGFHLTVRPALEAEKLGIPSVIKLANHKGDLADKPGWRSILGLPQIRRKWIRDRVSAVIAISRDIEDELKGYGIPESKIIRIPNGVDTNLFRPASEEEKRILRAQLGWPDIPTIVFVGRVNRRKRPHLLVRALRKVLNKGIDCQLILAGPDGEAEYVESIRESIASLKLSSRVHWVGFTEDVAALYRASDIFALISENEGMPNALLEAMATGLPAVVTQISGTSDLIDHDQTGIFVEPDADEVAEAFAWLIDHDQQRKCFGTEARGKVLREYSVDAVLRRHEELFCRLLSGGVANP